MTRLLILFFLIMIACNPVRNISRESSSYLHMETSYPNKIIDSVSISNNLSIPSLDKWKVTYMRTNDSIVYKLNSYTKSISDTLFIFSVGGYVNDSIYLVKFRKEW